MKCGYLIKGVSSDKLSADELKLINNYTRRDLKKEEVYVFSVVLCDNEIDRDYECFTKESLDKLAEMFVGKTGIVDHDMKCENQKARIFDCKVDKVDGKLTSYKKQYYRLLARAYMPKTDENKDFILEIDSGIKKEVSVSCCINKYICSICGSDQSVSPCRHIKGRKYENQNSICHVLLEEPTDAYEWSFVAVPAQRSAGVIKRFGVNSKGGDDKMDSIIKALSLGEDVELSRSQAKKLYNLILELEELSKDGKVYRNDMKKEVVRLCSIAQPNIDSKTMESVADKMTMKELKSFRDSFEEDAYEKFPKKPQLSPNKSLNEKQEKKNTQFKI